MGSGGRGRCVTDVTAEPCGFGTIVAAGMWIVVTARPGDGCVGVDGGFGFGDAVVVNSKLGQKVEAASAVTGKGMRDR